MDSDTLNTASVYLNNLLLARGLLRNGKSLDFGKPTRDTRAQIINLVHDLLLRRDREQESREHAAQTLRALRLEQTKNNTDIERFRTRLAEKDRDLTQAQVEVRNAKAGTRRLETSAKNLHDQLAKLKASVGQIKTQCAADIKKRDLQIERLKSHLQGQQRGNKSTVVAPTITISGGSGGSRAIAAFNASVRELQDPEYSLKQESNEFLTQLGQSLSDENDGLIILVRNTLRTLKQSLGLSDAVQSQDGTMGDLDYRGISLTASTHPVTFESLSSELEATMAMLKSVLTSPNFVSMEEVEIRDEEIARLREGWMQMEARWKDVLAMMDGWRKRMERTGDTINLDDLKKGFGLGASLNDIRQVSKPYSALPRGRASSLSSTNSVDDEEEEGINGNRDSVLEGGAMEVATSAKKERGIFLENATIDPPDFFDLRPVQGQKLRQLSRNIQSPRRVAFADATDLELDPGQENSPVAKGVSLQAPKTEKQSPGPRTEHPSVDRKQTRSSRKRHSSPHPLPEERSPKHPTQDYAGLTSSSFVEDELPHFTMQEKLRLAQLEAEQAAALRADEVVKDSSHLDLELEDDLGKLRSPVKKTKIKGRPRRRKSTLSPEELESLLGLE